MERTKRSLYQSLEQWKRQFRLLRLLESDTNQTRCEMKSFSLVNDNLPPWKALSYRWGEDNPEFTISLNDHPIRVRKGLQTFITQIIAEKRQDWYFIDALCIDQDNESERAVQVQQMGEIYRRAEEVVVWIVYEPYHYEKDETHWLRVAYDSDDATYDFASLSPVQVNRAVLENSYWSRLWVVQEVLLAKRLTIRIGNAEVEWSDLLPKRSIFDHRGLGTMNEKLGNPWQHGTEPFANKETAQNILSYRRYKTESLRAGHHLPFHKALEFFALQRCGRPHDMVFGYLGLTNSRIQIDYSMPILDLFVATLADWLISAGFVRQDLTGYRGRLIVYRITTTSDVTAPLLAFRLDPYHPVVHLLFREVTKFFAPDFEEDLIIDATMTLLLINRWGRNKEVVETFISNEHNSGLKRIVSKCLKTYKLIASGIRVSSAEDEEIAARLKVLEEEDAVMSAPGDSGGSKTYSQWARHARAISLQIWQRFVEAGEDAAGGVNDQSSTLTS